MRYALSTEEVVETRGILGADVGGTFTDILALDPDTGAIVGAEKVPSTPADPGEAIIDGADRYCSAGGAMPQAMFHGTTVGTNTLIERKGVKAALLTTRGFRDVLALRRQARPRLYDLAATVSAPLIDRDHRIEVDERVRHDGSVKRALDQSEVTRVLTELKRLDVGAVAISLLHSYANDSHERMLGEAIVAEFPELHLTLSSDICREYREFERTSTAAVNAYIGPTVSRYLRKLGGKLGERGVANLSIMKSNGGLTSSENAARFPAQLIESGPAAGIIATAMLGNSERIGDLIAFDMGGTTAKVGVVKDGKPRLSNEFVADQFVNGRNMGGYPIKSPAIDIIEIGAGGGSIAWIDPAGVLRVGPKSAGSLPGPACYGRGGDRPTVTDAHVVLGHITPTGFGSKDIEISVEKAVEAIKVNVADPLGWSVHEGAAGILRLATAAMAEMVRLATLRRGLDPRDFCLVASGGAGPLHAAEIAREVGVPTVLIPPIPGLFSAIGTVLGEQRHDLVQASVQLLASADLTQLEKAFRKLRVQADELIQNENVIGVEAWRFEREVDLRYEGQLFEVTLPAPLNATEEDFDQNFRRAYRESYGYELADNPVELVAARLVARRKVWSGGWPTLQIPRREDTQSRSSHSIYDQSGEKLEVPVIPRSTLTPGELLLGPLIIEDLGATIRVLSGQQMLVRESGVLAIDTRTEQE